MVAFEFPPSNGASVPRIESFYRYLKQWGWRVVVLTASPQAYERINSNYKDSSDDLVFRTFTLDVPRHLSIKGKYWAAMERPDRWGLTWIPSALFTARKLIKKYQPDAIWSSSPIPSTHYIANYLSQKHQLPWVADYRDPFHYMNGSAGSYLDKQHKAIDRNTLHNATQLTFATAQVKTLYEEQYGDLVKDKSTVIENGYDEANFERLSTLKSLVTPFSENKFSLYYSGVLYPNGRDPRPIFEAIAELNNSGMISPHNFELVFQGAGDGQEFQLELAQNGIETMVKFVAPVSFMEALNNMMHADALLLIQDKRFNKQIPGKIYEYLRTQKPMLLKAPSEGATYQLAKQYEGIYAGENKDTLVSKLITLLTNKHTEIARDVSNLNRESRAQQLHDILGRATRST